MNECCPACGKMRKLTNRGKVALCSTCNILTDNVRKNPQYLDQLSQLTDIQISSISFQPPYKLSLNCLKNLTQYDI